MMKTREGRTQREGEKTVMVILTGMQDVKTMQKFLEQEP